MGRLATLQMMLLLLACNAYAATPGLPFTEDFSADNLKDGSGTTAEWNTVKGLLQMGEARKRYGAFSASTLTQHDIGAEADVSTCAAAGDMDGDGLLDLVVGNHNAPSRIYLHDGDGDPFDNATSVAITSDARATRAIVVADFDRDGDLDVITGNYDDQKDRYYENQGDGTSWVGSDLSSDTLKTTAIAVADFDGDSFLDLIITAYQEKPRIYINNAPGAVWTVAAGTILDNVNPVTKTLCMAAADFDNDGDTDVAMGNQNQANRVYLNGGNGASWTLAALGTEEEYTAALAVADVDADGDVDIVAGNRNQANRLYKNNSSGTTWTSSAIDTDADDTQSVALADVDGDGDFDLIAGNNGIPKLYLNSGLNAPWSPTAGGGIGTTSFDSRGVALADFDRDGDPDLATANAGGGTGELNRYFSNEATGNPFQAVEGQNVTPDARQSMDIALGDIDGDGDLDAVVGSENLTNQLYLNNGGPNPWEGITASIIGTETDATRVVKLADMDRDEDLDVIVGNDATNRIYFNEGGGRPWTPAWTVTNITEDIYRTYALAVGDLDNDGDLDIVTGNGVHPVPTKNRVYLNDGGSPPSWAASDLSPDNYTTKFLELADMDGDDDLDVVQLNNNTAGEELMMFVNNGSGDPWVAQWQKINIDPTRQMPQVMAMGDIDGDADIDIMIEGSRYLNTGTATPFVPLNRFSVPWSPVGLEEYELQDMDSDGDLDLLTISRADWALPHAITLNDGTASPFTSGTLSPISSDILSTRRVATGDVDNDGDMDIVTAEIAGPKVNRYYANPGAPYHPWADAEADWLPQGHTSARGVAAGDINRDGAVDIAVAGWDGGDSYIMLNNGTENPFTDVSPFLFTGVDRVGTVALGDVNEDGYLDLLMARGYGYQMYDYPNYLFLNNQSDEPFALVDPITVGSVHHVSVDVDLADLDRDGSLDLIVGNANSPNQIFLNGGEPDLFSDASPAEIGTSGWNEVADLNGDGWPDLLVSGFSGNAYAYLNQGLPDLFEGAVPQTLYNSSGTSVFTECGDVDRDGDLDVLVHPGSQNNYIRVLFNVDGTATNWLTRRLPSVDNQDYYAQNVAKLCDLDKDGDLDIVTYYGPQGHLMVFWSNGSTDPWSDGARQLFPQTYPGSAGIFSMALGDFDRDGATDIFAGRAGYSGGYQFNTATPGLYRRIGYRSPSASHAASLEVDDSTDGILVTQLTDDASVPPNTRIDYWLSNDGGQKWHEVLPGRARVFPVQDNQLHWRAELHTLLPLVSPQITQLDIVGGIPFVDPPVPNIHTWEDVPATYDLTLHGNDPDNSGAALQWNVEPADDPLFTASVLPGDLLSITPKLNQTGQRTVTLTLMDETSIPGDGATFDQQEITVTIDYRPPTAPTPFILPLVPYTTDNLYCALFPGFVGPGRTALYEYVWSNGIRSIARPLTPVPADELSAAETQPGERWTCTVRAYDGATWSAPLSNQSAIILDKTVTSLTLQLSAAEITLGQFVNIAASIAPVVGVVPVTFDQSASPPGGTNSVPSTQSTNSSSAFSLDFLPNEAGTWALNAQWAGNQTHYPTGDTATLGVAKAQPTLTVALSAASVPASASEFSASVTLSAGFPAQLQSLLGNRPIKLSVRDPFGATTLVNGTTNASGVASFPYSAFSAINFSQAGTWQFLALFEGNANLLQATSPNFDTPGAARLTVKDGAGYAIICVGQLDQNAEGLASHAKTAEFVYGAFLDRGFAHEDIQYLTPDAPPVGSSIVVDDATPTKAELLSLVEGWAATSMNNEAAPLYVVLVGHGSEDAFYVYRNSYDPALRILTPAQLDTSLSTLEASLTGDAATQDIHVVYGACHSGTFIDELSAPGRILVTSTREEELSHRGVEDPSVPGDVRDGEPFLTEYFRALRNGLTAKAAFERAASIIEEFTATTTSGGIVPQHPLLDDNGDGLGSTRLELAFEGGYDGAVAHESVLGFGANAAGDSIGWFTAPATVTLAPGQTLELIAQATEAPATGHTAWIEVKTPGFDGADAASTASGPQDNYSNFQQVLNLQVLESDTADSDAQGNYTWSNFGTAFDAPGTYKVYYYVKDGTTGETSAHILTTVYRQAVGNTPPPVANLVFPADGATVTTSTFFVWEPVTDPDDDHVTYRIELATDANFTQNFVSLSGIEDFFTQAPGLVDARTYYWRVIPVDAFGAEPISAAPVRTVVFNNTNSTVVGALRGHVVSAGTTIPVVGAQATATSVGGGGGGFGFATATGDFFIAGLPADSYTIAVTADGYAAATVGPVFVVAGQSSSLSSFIELAPNTATGDVDGSGTINALDATLINLYLLIGEEALDAALPPDISDFNPATADVNRHGGVTSLDATLINLQQLMGKTLLNQYLQGIGQPISHAGEAAP